MSTYYTDEHGARRCMVCDAPEGYEDIMANAVELIREHHNMAMSYLDVALIFKMEGKCNAQNAHVWKAMKHEVAAAKLALNTNIEPSRSVLCRSAAQLCVECGELEEAESLIAAALSGNPPFEIVVELEAIRSQINSPGA